MLIIELVVKAIAVRVALSLNEDVLLNILDMIVLVSVYGLDILCLRQAITVDILHLVVV
jgi:hypothetical protein